MIAAIIAACATALALIGTVTALVVALLGTKDALASALVEKVALATNAEGLRAQLKDKESENGRLKNALDDTTRRLGQAEAAAIVGLPDSDLRDHVNGGVHPDSPQGGASPGARGNTAAGTISVPDHAAPVATGLPGPGVSRR